jgi:hypothetical protein
VALCRNLAVLGVRGESKTAWVLQCSNMNQTTREATNGCSVYCACLMILCVHWYYVIDVVPERTLLCINSEERRTIAVSVHL